jgi:acyl-CoA synthetase (NDP forming)
MADPIVFPDLTRLVNPRSIVLVGASDRADSIGARTLENLTLHSQWDGRLSLVNPSRDQIGARPCLRSVDALDHEPDVAIVAVRADNTLETLEACSRKGVRFAIVFTSGFGEVHEAGREIEARMRDIARRTGMRIYGPNCPGLNNINGRLGMTFSPAWRTDSKPGPIGLATQGGGLGRSFLQSMDRGLGTGVWFSAGNEADLEVSDYIHYLADAPDIRVIVTVLEGVRDGARFVAAALHAARRGKPIVALKIGKSDYGIRAAQSHTAAIAGSAEVNSAVLRELGVVEVDDVEELADVASLLARRMPTGREKFAVYCFSGGTVALAADRVGAEQLELSHFAEDTVSRLRAALPPYAAVGNPVDVTAEVLVDPALVYTTIKATAQDPNTDMVLVPLPVEYGRTTVVLAENMVKVQAEVDTPIVPVWMSDRSGEGHRLLIEGGLMPLRSVRNAALALKRYVQHGRWRADFDPAWTPVGPASTAAADKRSVSEPAAKALLARAGVSVPSGILVRSASDVAAAFRELGGGPVALKVASSAVTHKSDIGGVRLNIRDPLAAQVAFGDIMDAARKVCGDAAIEGVLVESMLEGAFVEAVVGFHRDPVFGHLCTFGLGGVSIELFKDVSRRMLPLTPASARAMVEETRCYALLAGYRGRARFDVDALVSTLVQLSDFVVRHAASIEELEINPLAVRPQGQGVAALDAVLIVSMKESNLW